MTDKERLIVAEIPRLRRYARALTGDAAAADDLVQDCLERAWSRFRLWRRGSNMRAWLFTIMHNIHANDLRKARGRPADLELSEDITGGEDPRQVGAVESLALARALARLPEDQRAIVLLVSLGGHELRGSGGRPRRSRRHRALAAGPWPRAVAPAHGTR